MIHFEMKFKNEELFRMSLLKVSSTYGWLVTSSEFKWPKCLPICSDIYREFQTEFRIVSDISIDFQNILFKTTNSYKFMLLININNFCNIKGKYFPFPPKSKLYKSEFLSLKIFIVSCFLLSLKKSNLNQG
jgi:hypothetical protein